MIKIDLITGFLGAGKTTFLKKYAQHFIENKDKIGIIENDYGAVNVDMLLLHDLEGEFCELEMIAGGCDLDCHKRRFKTKLISMGMRGFSRIIVEPSGIFDVDEFFDLLQEEPLDRWYEIGNVFTIIDANMDTNMSKQAEFFMASQLARAGKVVFSRTQNMGQDQLQKTTDYMNRTMESIQCKRRFTLQDIMTKNWDDWETADYARLHDAGYVKEDYVKLWIQQDETFQSVYFLNLKDTIAHVEESIQKVFQNDCCGNVFRIKGYVPLDKGKWMEINATRKGTSMQECAVGQDVLIVIGEKLNEDLIKDYFYH